MGVYEHKIIKNQLASMDVYQSIKNEKTIGIIGEDIKNKIIEIAYPFGVIAAICPTTNPTSTAIFKTLISLKTGNGIIVSPHPFAKKSTIKALEICRTAAESAGAPKGLINWISEPSIELTKELMEHEDIDLILATGGSGLVKQAYSSGKPAYGVGPGNGPSYIDKSANVKKSVQLIVNSKSFDNGTLCSSEQSLIIHKNVKNLVMRELKINGAYLLDENEKRLLEKTISPERGKLNTKIVGKSAKYIANLAGFSVPEDTRVLIAEENEIGYDAPMSIEKLSPILPLYFVNNEEEAITIASKILDLGGKGHTCSIHANDNEIIIKFGLKMPVSRIVVNSYSSIGAAGGTTGLKPSLTLGCGSYGGNISSDNITARHLINIKRIAYGLKEIDLPKVYENNYDDLESKDIDLKINPNSNEELLDESFITKIVQNIMKELNVSK